MADTRGVFSLRLLNLLNSKSKWVDLDDVWVSEGTPYTGYFGGGRTPSAVSTMDKVTYSTDTTGALPGSPLSAARYLFAATGNSDAGYFGGGSPGTLSTMEKVIYSTDGIAPVPGANLTISRWGLAATGNSTAGYFGGGGFPITTAMEKITYSDDTIAAVPGAGLSDPRYLLTATGNSVAGYFGGGSPGRTTIYKLTYSTDTTDALPGSPLSFGRHSLAATGNSTAGYFGGGLAPSLSPSDVSTMDKLTYSDDTIAAVPGANLTGVRFYLAATGNSGAGYFGGGQGPSLVSTMDKVTYSTETTGALSATGSLSSVRIQLAASSVRANALRPTTDLKIRFSDGVAPPNTGYFGGGFPVASTMDKVDYSTDTTDAVPGAALSCLLYTSPSPRDKRQSRMPSSA